MVCSEALPSPEEAGAGSVPSAACSTFADSVSRFGVVCSGVCSDAGPVVSSLDLSVDSPSEPSSFEPSPSLAGASINCVHNWPVDQTILRNSLRSSRFSPNFSTSRSVTPLKTSSTELKPLSTRTNLAASSPRSSEADAPESTSSARGSSPC